MTLADDRAALVHEAGNWLTEARYFSEGRSVQELAAETAKRNPGLAAGVLALEKVWRARRWPSAEELADAVIEARRTAGSRAAK